MATLGDLSFPTSFWQILWLSVLCSGPAAACVVKDSEGRPAFAVKGPLNWHCVPRGPGKSDTAQGDIDFAPVDGRRGWGERITLEPGGMTMAGMFHNLRTGSNEYFGVETLRTQVEAALAQGDVVTWFPGYLGSVPKVGVPRWLVRVGDPVSMAYPFACTPHPGMDFTCEGLRPLSGDIYLHFTLTAPFLPVSDWEGIEARIVTSVLEAIVPIKDADTDEN